MLPDRSGSPAHDHGHALHEDSDLQGTDWSANELAIGRREDLEEEPARGHSYWSLSVRRLARKKLAVVCLWVIVMMYGGALLSPLVTPYEYTAQDISQSRAGPTLAHPFGADRLGRDMMTRVIYGLRTTVIITIISLLGGTLVLGIVLGLLSGYMGRWVDSVIMRTGEVTSSFPDIILILIFVAALRPRLVGAVQGFEDATGIDWILRLGIVDYAIISFALSIFGWFGMARLVRGQVLQARESQYTEAALVAGATTARILRVHVLPNILSPLIVSISAGLAGVAGAELVLSWIGIGVQPPVPSLGRMMFENGSIQVLRNEPHLILFPIGAVTLLFFCFNILGDAVNDAFNPRAR
jgi:ABC-type dipeptide/oligopeptide/nickel transport system permease subunit